jgi:drug/metabolite transporter superfamily protein YnfA
MRTISAILLALFPVLGHTEVMDKELSLVTVLLWGLIGALSVFLTARLKPLLLFILLPVISLFFFGHLSELMDPYVGPAMAAEAGNFYVYISWIAPALVLISGGIGLVFHYRNVKAKT